MRKLAKIAAPALAAIAALGAVAPASAQDWGRGGYHEDYRGDYRGGWRGDRGMARSLYNQIAELQRVADSRGGRDSRFARSELWKVRSALDNYTRDGLNRTEVRAVQYQLDRIRNLLSGYRDDYRGGYGRGDYGRDGYRGW